MWESAMCELHSSFSLSFLACKGTIGAGEEGVHLRTSAWGSPARSAGQGAPAVRLTEASRMGAPKRVFVCMRDSVNDPKIAITVPLSILIPPHLAQVCTARRQVFPARRQVFQEAETEGEQAISPHKACEAMQARLKGLPACQPCAVLPEKPSLPCSELDSCTKQSWLGSNGGGLGGGGDGGRGGDGGEDAKRAATLFPARTTTWCTL